LLQLAAGGQRGAAVEDADVVEAEEASLEDVLSKTVLATRSIRSICSLAKSGSTILVGHGDDVLVQHVEALLFGVHCALLALHHAVVDAVLDVRALVLLPGGTAAGGSWCYR